MVGEKEVSLLFSKTNDLMCQVFDTRTKKSIQHDAFECIFPSYRCHAKTIKLIEEIKTKSMEDIVDFLEGFTLSNVIDHNLSKRDPDSDLFAKRCYF